MVKEDMQDYKEVYDNLKAPEQWKTDIKALMKEELKKDLTKTPESEQTNNTQKQGVIDFESKRKNSKQYRMLLATGGIAAALFLAITIPQLNGPRFITPLKDGEIQSEVALKDASLYFEIEDTSVLAGKSDAGDNTVHFAVDDTGEVTSSDNAKESSGEPSYIKGVTVYLTITKLEDGYQYTAQYEKDGEKCEFTRSGISQKEFIKLLYKEL